MRLSRCVLALSVATIFSWLSGAAVGVSSLPDDCQMSKADGQRLLLAALENPTDLGRGSYRINSLFSRLAPQAVGAKVGATALEIGGVALSDGCKGHFHAVPQVPGQCRWIGLWVYLSDSSNVATVGLQFTDAEKEDFIATVPADWKGWRWVEIDVTSTWPQAWKQPEKNKKVDLPLSGTSVVWTTRDAGPTSLIVDGLQAITQLSDADRPATTLLQTPSSVAPQQPFHASLLLTNLDAKPVEARITWQVQRDSQFHDAPPARAGIGIEVARGQRSWTVIDDQRTDDNVLTDGKSYTSTSTAYRPKSWEQTFQYIDLGQVRKISHVAMQSGDANWMYKVDVHVSLDDKKYEPIAELQNVNLFKRWGQFDLPAVATPMAGRYLRLRYHNGGEKVDKLHMPSAVQVFERIDGELPMPAAGPVLAQGTSTATVAGRQFTLLPIEIKEPLSSGSYLLATRITLSQSTNVTYEHVYVMPAPLTLSPQSRFGINSSNGDNAPILRELGVSWVRFENMKWPFISPAPGEYRYDGSVGPWHVNHDAIIDSYRSQGISVLPLLFMTPKYASSQPEAKRFGTYPPKDNAGFGEFVFQTVARYGSKSYGPESLLTPDKISAKAQMTTYEMWNEPNLVHPDWGAWIGPMDQYLELFRVGAEAAKNADPTAIVTSGGFAGIKISVVDALRTHTYSDGKHPIDFVDVLNVHTYTATQPPEISTQDTNIKIAGQSTLIEDLERLSRWRDLNLPGKEIWMTETGYDTGGPEAVDERTQAARLPRMVMLCLAHGMQKVFVYRDTGSTPTRYGASGVLRNDLSLKPSFLTYATLIRQLDGVDSTATRIFTSDPNVWVYAWNRGTQTILTAWTVDGAGKLETNLGPSTVVDAFGSEQQLDLSHGIAVSEFPTYIRPRSISPELQKLITLSKERKQQAEADRKKRADLRAYLFNFGGDPTQVISEDLGKERPYVPVNFDDTFSKNKTFGFTAPVQKRDPRKWVHSDLDRTQVVVTKEQSFRVKITPGRYTLKLSLTSNNAGTLKIDGVKGTNTASYVSGDTLVNLDIDATGPELVLSSDKTAGWCWLTIIERPN